MIASLEVDIFIYVLYYEYIDIDLLENRYVLAGNVIGQGYFTSGNVSC